LYNTPKLFGSENFGYEMSSGHPENAEEGFPIDKGVGDML
jgi:hypothetical protein